jgi:hypothetical protein
MNKSIKAFWLSAGLVCLGGTAGWAQIKITTPECSISFGSGWAMFDTAQLAIVKDDGTSGVAMIRSWVDDGTTPLDIDEETQALGDSVEARVTLTKDETKTLGAYTVRVFTLDYDTLHRVERVAKAHGRNNTFRNGTLRAYIVRSGGIRVNIIGVYAISLFTPYAGIEQAIPTLAMTPPVSARARSTLSSMASWSVIAGKLRFADEAPREVFARDGLGRQVGITIAVSSSGEWDLPYLPSGHGPLLLYARFRNGRFATLGWWNGGF